MAYKKIYCAECGKEVQARLTHGDEIYPRRKDLKELPFWKCDTCGNSVGCHHKTNTPTRPLGIIPSKALKRQRRLIHAMMDPIWQSGEITRKQLYSKLSQALGREFHTAELRNTAETNLILDKISIIRRQVFSNAKK